MSQLSEDLRRERAAVGDTLREVGPAAGGCGWSAFDLAIHLATGELAAGVPNAPFRWLVGHGVRLDRMAPVNERILTEWRRRRDFAWALHRLARRAPPPHRHGVVGAVSLLEFWAHHEDLIAANRLEGCRTSVDLTPVLHVLVRYHHRALVRHAVVVASGDHVWHTTAGVAGVTVNGSREEVARWLSGRTSLDTLGVFGEPARVASLASLDLSL